MLQPKSIEVVAAVIIHQGKILCTQRGWNKHAYISNKWEFPGGKVELGESWENALVREIKEELQLDIANLIHFTTVHHTYPDFELIMHAFIAETLFTMPVLIEHLDYQWLPIQALNTLDFAAADLPIVMKLQSLNPPPF